LPIDSVELTLSSLEECAARALEPRWRDYVAGGAGGERTLRRNVEAFGRYALSQRVLRGIEQVDLATRVLGLDLRLPVLVAPVAYLGALHRDGEEGLARAASHVGAGFCLSTFSNAAPATVAAAAPGAQRLYQVYVFRDHGVTDELIAQALDAGFAGLLLTVDLPLQGARDRELLHEWARVDDDLPAIVYARARGSDPACVDLIDPALDWSYLEGLCSRFDVPVVLKGVLEPDDARRAVESGASGVVVSNHGGRQLDPARAALDALPAVAEAVGGGATVLFDSGVRRGSDVAVALALGADAVLCGRVPAWSLAIGGEQGAARALELLRDELAVTLHLMGCASVGDVGPDCARPA
jgi:isopentenyl diphosphate isomerase/L-lactate dehydrogenase-like FMN-dependent dehydrogenase